MKKKGKKKVSALRSAVKGRERGRMKTGVVMALLLILCILPAVFINNIYGYLPIFTYVFLLLISQIYLNILTKSLVYEDKSQLYSCMREESMEFCLSVENKSILVYPYVRVKFFMTDIFGERDQGTDTVITLAPKEKRDFVFDVRFDHLGKYSVGLEKVEVRGLLGVRKVTMPGGGEHIVEVYPHIWQLADLKVSEKVQTEDSKSKVSIETDGSDYTGVREYVMGDSIKNIHWKLSAHSNGYLTKQMETFGSSGVDVVLDLCGPECEAETAMSLFDTLVETAVAIGYYAQSKGTECEITYLSREKMETRLNAGQTEFYRSMIWELPPVADKREDYDVMRLLERVSGGMYARSNVVLCTALLTPEIVRTLVSIRMRRQNPVLFYVVPDNVYDREREELLKPVKLLEDHGISYSVISFGEELQ